MFKIKNLSKESIKKRLFLLWIVIIFFVYLVFILYKLRNFQEGLDNSSVENLNSVNEQIVLNNDSESQVDKNQIKQQIFFEKIGLGSHPSLHSSSASFYDDDILLLWFAGQREGAKDVGIYSTYLEDNPRADAVDNDVGITDSDYNISKIISRENLSSGLKRYISKIGNPLVWIDDNQTIHLWVVSVSIGGWAGSSLNYLESNDFGKSWHLRKRLILSPFINISNLVKYPPIKVGDGVIILPSYHEFISKYTELIWMDMENMKPLKKTRLNKGTIQSSIVNLDGVLKTFSRNTDSNKKVGVSVSDDKGITWNSGFLDLQNPNSAVHVIKLRSGELLLVGNIDIKERKSLDLFISNDYGLSWQHVLKLDDIEDIGRLDTPPNVERSYPWVLETQNGIHIFYTWSRKAIAHAFITKKQMQDLLR